MDYQLWPSHLLKNNIQPSKDLIRFANKCLNEMPSPIVKLSSAGKTSLADKQLVETRVALQDTEKTICLSLMWFMTQKKNYLNKCYEFLKAWSEKNIPTGHPIDETRLDLFIWAFDLIRNQLNNHQQQPILDWFNSLRVAKTKYKWGPLTSINNHKTHHFKMLILLDKILDDKSNYEMDLKLIAEHLAINIDKEGCSIDYQQRKALYYHVFNLEAWLEICLITQEFKEEITSAVNFLLNKLNHQHIEFIGSEVKLDKIRSDQGFAYAKKGAIFEVGHALLCLTTYETCFNAELKTLQSEGQNSSKRLLFLNMRKQMWNNLTLSLTTHLTI